MRQRERRMAGARDAANSLLAPVDSHSELSIAITSYSHPPGNKSLIHWIKPPRLRFRDIALFLLGSGVLGCIFALLTGLPVYGLTHSKFVVGSIATIALYATFKIGYHRTSQVRGWIDLHARFSPVGRKPLVLSALSAIAILAFLAMVHWMLLRAGVNFAQVPSPLGLDSWTQMPLALLALVLVDPLTEELLFRGLLLDWLRSKMNVWAAAVILSMIFSLLHANPFSLGAVGWFAFSARLALGFAASAVTIKYRSLRPAFVMHATWNAIGCIASVLNDA
jgi:membrane protease YdiL (CAAX protease family)